MNYDKLVTTQLNEISRFYNVETLGKSLENFVSAEDRLVELWNQNGANFGQVLSDANKAFEGAITETYNFLVSLNLIEAPAKKSFLQLEQKISALEKSNLFDKNLIDWLRSYKTEWRNISTHNTSKPYSKSEAIKALALANAVIVLLLEQLKEIVDSKSTSDVK